MIGLICLLGAGLIALIVMVLIVSWWDKLPSIPYKDDDCFHNGEK